MNKYNNIHNKLWNHIECGIFWIIRKYGGALTTVKTPYHEMRFGLGEITVKANMDFSAKYRTHDEAVESVTMELEPFFEDLYQEALMFIAIEEKICQK